MKKFEDLDIELSDTHYSRYRRPVSPRNTPATRKAGIRSCPEPGEFTVDEEIYWLLVIAQQIGWPLPVAIRNGISAHRLNRFTVDQIRFLIRKEPRLSVLNLAVSGVPLLQMNAIWAASILKTWQSSATSIAKHPLYGAWPVLTIDAERSWDAERGALFQSNVAPLDLPTVKLAWRAMLLAQCGWPMPAAVTRRFPKFWVRRKTPIELVAAIFGGRKDMTVADAVLAGVEVKDLSRDMLIGAVARMVSAPADDVDSPSDDAYGHLCSFFSEDDRDFVDEGLLADLAEKMRGILTGGDQNKGQRLTFGEFLHLRHAGRDPADSPYLQFRVPTGEPTEDESTDPRASTPVDQPGDTSADEVLPTRPLSSPPTREAPIEQHADDDETAEDSSSDGDAEPSEAPGSAAPDQTTVVETPHSARIEILDSGSTRDLVDLAVLRSRLGLDLSEEQRVALPSDSERRDLSPYRIVELMPPPRPAFLDVAWKAFGHEMPPIEGRLRELLEKQAAGLRNELIVDINKNWGKDSQKFKSIIRFNRHWMYDYKFYKRALRNSFTFDADNNIFLNYEYIIQPHKDTYNEYAFMLIEIMDFFMHFIDNEELTSVEIQEIFKETAEKSEKFAKLYTRFDFTQQRYSLIYSMIDTWKAIEEQCANLIVRSVRRD